MNNLNNINNKIIIISSPSGAGKTTICKYLLKKIDNVKLSISYTTRPKRKNERNKKDYFFVNREKFNELAKKSVSCFLIFSLMTLINSLLNSILTFLSFIFLTKAIILVLNNLMNY